MRKVNVNTPEEVRNWTIDAVRIVETCKVPGDLREAAFTKAMEYLAAQQVAVDASDLGRVALPQINLSPNQHR